MSAVIGARLRRRRSASMLAGVAGVLGACAVLMARAAAAHAQQLYAQPFVTSLSSPVAFTADPTDPTRYFVVEQDGLIRVVVGGVLQSAPFLDIRSDVLSGGERGLLGLAFDPDYATNRRFYVYFTRRGASAADLGDIVIARFTRRAVNPLQADLASRFDFQWGSSTGPRYIEHSEFGNHNGGDLQFGPDGYLYLGTGDGGAAGDPHNNAQNPNQLLGKILRIDVNVSDPDPRGYRIPPDNPFVDGVPVAALPEIWAFGLRNPWRFTFDDPARGGTGALIIADVGQNAWEEIDYEPAGTGGRNYGWRIREGAHDFNASTAAAFVPLTDPVFEYFHSSGASLVEGSSITGGYIYRGADLSTQWRGRYFFADFTHERIWSAQMAAGTGAMSNVMEHTAALRVGEVSSFGIDAAGELYIVRYAAAGQGIVYRLCEVMLTPGITAFANVGGSGTVAVATSAGCAWSVSSSAPWVTIVSNPGSGTGTLVLRVAPNTGPGARAATVTIAGTSVTITQRASPPVHGDLDANGSADLLWQHDDGLLAVWMMSGTTLLDGRPLGPGALADTAWRIVASGDFDRDGSPDIVFQHQGDGRLAVWLMSGAVQLSGSSLSPAQVSDTAWKIRAAADIDRDGWTDLIWQHQTNGSVAVWFMTGLQLRDGQLFSPGAVADLNWRIVGAEDMNRDGNADLVWQHQTSGAIAAWLMNGSTMTSGVLLSPGQVADTNWEIRAVTDVNGDGRPDLVWQNVSTGQVSAWLMNGLMLIDGSLLTPAQVADTSWQIVGPR